jgi:predicted ABC-class ATPase
LLGRIDGRPYPAWRDIKGHWRLDDWALLVDHVQGDPYAAPSRIRMRWPDVVDSDLVADPDRKLAAEDWLLRAFAEGLISQRRGSGRSGEMRVLQPGPEVLERSALRLQRDGSVEIRLRVGLPARGRRVLGREGQMLLLDDLPRAARSMCPSSDVQRGALDRHIRSVVRQRALRRQLRPRGLVAFIENDSVLPRRSGIHQAPLAHAVPFVSPPSLQVALDGPEGTVMGCGIPTGVTVLVGGGFHGKSTVLAALQRGHLDHIPGDGREGVVSDPDTVKIRAEDGRAIRQVDISAFLHDLPGGISTRPFSTEDASGSTSQAAAIIEAVQCGAAVLLFDEDTSATNLMVRDPRMRALIPRASEPITPLVERVRAMRKDWQISAVLAIGGVGDWLGVADVVLAMEHWKPRDVTEAARSLGVHIDDAAEALSQPLPRVLSTDHLRPGKIRARDDRSVRYGDREIDLVAVEQVLDADHAWTLGQALRFLHEEVADDTRTVRQSVDTLEAILDDEGVEVLSPRDHPDGGLIRPRKHEVAAALNRLRSAVRDRASESR